MNKRILILVVAILTLVLTACGSKTQDEVTQAKDGKTVFRYNGETGLVTPAELAEDLGYFEKISLEYTGLTKGGPESIQFVATDQMEFGNAFNGAIIKSVEKGVKIKGVVTSYGSNEENYLGFFAKKGTDIKEAKDLIGKKVAINIRGANYEMALQEYLYENGLTDEDIKEVEFIAMPMVNAEQAVVNNQVDVAALSNIFRDKALENGKTEVVFKDTEASGEYNAGSYFFKEDFIKSHEEEVKDFTQGVARAYEWMVETEQAEVIKRMEKIMVERDRGEPVENLKYWHGRSVVTEGGVIQSSDFDKWLELLVKTKDIKTTDIDTSKMFTNEYNPYNK